MNNVTLRNITGSYRALGALRGNPGDTLLDIRLEDIDVKLTEDAFAPGPVQNLVLKNVVVNGRPFEALGPAAKP